MNTTLVINRKGGAGKTTVSINLASYFVTANVATTIMDYDPQGSSLHWLKLRNPPLGKIHGSNAAPEKFGQLRSFGMYVPAETKQLIIDAPGGVSGVLLQELLCRANCVLIPVTPSSIDIHATAHFIKDVLLTGIVRTRRIRIGVIANRVRRSMPASDTRKHVNSTAPKPRHPNPNCHTHASTSSIVANSTSGYCAEIGAWQCRHLPRNTSQLKSGMFSYHESLCLQCGQCEGSTTMPGGGGS